MAAAADNDAGGIAQKAGQDAGNGADSSDGDAGGEAVTMMGALHKLDPSQQRQIWLVIFARAASGCAMSMLSAGASNDLLLRLNNGDFATTQRLLSAISTVNTLADFVLSPWIGGLIDAYGRKNALVFGEVRRPAPPVLFPDEKYCCKCQSLRFDALLALWFPGPPPIPRPSRPSCRPAYCHHHSKEKSLG